MSLPFGKKIKAGNYYLLKTSKSLSKEEAAQLRSITPTGVRKLVGRNTLPYIKLASISGVWSVEFAAVTTVFKFFDQCNAVESGGNFELDGVDRNNVEYLATLMFADTILIGDKEYALAKIKLRDKYLARAARLLIEEEFDVREEELRKEHEEAINEVYERNRHKEAILDMAKQLEEEYGDGRDEQAN